MARVVREILCIPASSSSSERVFSVGSLICSQRRSNLSRKRVEQLAILKLNKKVVREYEEKHGIPEKKHSPSPDDFEVEEDLNLYLSPEEVEDEFDLEGYEEVDDDEEEEEDLPVIELD